MSGTSLWAASCVALAVLTASEPALASPPAQAQAMAESPATTVDPQATAALDRMSAYLAGLGAFEVTSNASQDLVLEDGGVVKLGLYARYLIGGAQKLYAEVHSDRQHRNFYFDGATLTMTAPRMGYYASASTSGSIRDLIDVLADDYGIELPLADLFLWQAREDGVAPAAAAVIGYAEVNGQETDQYLFTGPRAQWQVWIKRGEQPLPLRLVVTDTVDSARPQFAADLVWNLTPGVSAEAFTFRAPGAARRIVFGELSSQESDQ